MPLATEEQQIKYEIILYSVRIANFIFVKMLPIPNAGEDVEREELPLWWWKRKILQQIWKAVNSFFFFFF